MAMFRCCERHSPEAVYRAYVHPAQALHCDVTGCAHLAVVWLDPEEVHEYGLGTRVFWECSSLTRLRVDTRPLVHLDAVSHRQGSTFLLGHWHERRG
jgi:hypothetical protein